MILNPDLIKSISEEIAGLISEGRYKAAAKKSADLSSTRIGSILTDFDEKTTADFLLHLPPVRAGRVAGNMHPKMTAAALSVMDRKKAKIIINSVPPDNLSKLIYADNSYGEYLLNLLNKKMRGFLQTLQSFPPGSAGRIISPYFLTISETQSVGETLETLLSAPEEVEKAPYIFVTDNEGKPRGVISIKDMLRVKKTVQVKEVMNPDLVTVKAEDTAVSAAVIIRNRRLMLLPVINSDGRIAGVITFDDAMKVLTGEAMDLIALSAAVPEESFFTPPMRAVKGRLPWMGANIFLNMGAVAVITGFEETIAAVALLAAFIPMITDMGGNVGIQSLSVAIRSIALGDAKPKDVGRVIKKEVLIGLVNGLALGLLFALIAFLLRGNPYLGILAGTALGINVLVAGIVGGALPFLIKAFGKDPAMMTGPVLTTITDITGVSIYLGLSTIFISYIL